jgi:hypothetical protein
MAKLPTVTFHAHGPIIADYSEGLPNLAVESSLYQNIFHDRTGFTTDAKLILANLANDSNSQAWARKWMP